MKADRSKLKMMINQIIGGIVFMIGIIASYQGALNQKPWLGPLVVLIIIAYDLLAFRKLLLPKLKLLAAVAILGILTESILIITSVYSVELTTRWLVASPFSPLWILALWLNFGIRVPSYLLFLRGKHIVNAITGFVFAILIFRSANALGLLSLNNGTVSLIICAIAWGIVIPIVYIVAAKIFILPTTKK